MICSPTRTAPRSGLSLLEVVIAMAIFLFSLIAIGRLVTMSADRAVDVQRQAEAAQICQAKLHDVISGYTPLTPQSDVPYDLDPDWHWSLDCEQGNVTGLWTVHVTVSRDNGDGSKMETSLHEMILDPSIRGSTADAAASSSSSSQNGSSANGSSSNGQNSNSSTQSGSTSPTSAGGSKTTPTSSGSTKASTGGSSGAATKASTGGSSGAATKATGTGSSGASSSSTKSTGSSGTGSAGKTTGSSSTAPSSSGAKSGSTKGGP